MNRSLSSDIVFPEHLQQLQNFTSIENNDEVRITIPASYVARLNTSESGKSHFHELLFISQFNFFAELSVVHIIFRNIEDFLPINSSVLKYIH